MTPAKEAAADAKRKEEGVAFYKLVLALWGEDWRPRLRALLAEHGHRYTQRSAWATFRYWKDGERLVPEWVAVILLAEKQRRKPGKGSVA